MRSLVRGVSVPGGGGGAPGAGAPTDATYIVQTGHGDLSAEQALASLSTGLVKVTNGTGVLSTAAAGTDYQAASANLDEYAAVNPTAAGLALLDDADNTAQRTTLGLGTIATQNANNVSISGGSVTGITDLAIADGGTGQSTATAAFDALAPTTTQGDLIYHNGTDNVRLAAGTAFHALRMNSGATAPEWAAQRWMTQHNAGDAGGLNPADSTTYYWGQFSLFDPSTTSASQRMTIDRACRITDVRIVVIVAGTLGTAENVTWAIRKNDTTDTALTDMDFDTALRTVTTAVAIDFAAGDDFVIKFVCPAWVTNPTVTFFAAQIWWMAL